MLNAIQKLSKELPYACFTDKELKIYLPNKSDDSRYALIKRAQNHGDIARIRRGLYCFGSSLRNANDLNTFAVAQQIYGPSYISFESALAYHQWIPEAVYTTTSATTKRSKTFETSLGAFQFYRLPNFDFFCGVNLQIDLKTRFLMATPLKALCDYVYIFKKSWKNTEPLLKSLRIEEADLKTIQFNEFSRLENYYQSERIYQFLKGLKGDLK
ncbi:MAG: hypothetical protein JSS53_04150 [Proteobacteria bacterium]|nr:hypothetical protein [Pseudomonadota bacterium]